jgi:hypothetical protein
MAVLTQARLKEALEYFPETGEFVRRASSGGKLAGTRAGGKVGGGYVLISVDGMQYLAHRLAWLYMRGSLPDHEVDHRDTDRSNNRWTNLRKATRSEQSCNASIRVDNTSGVKGVYLDRRDGMWYGQVAHEEKTFNTKRFPTKEQAGDAVAALRSSLHGEYARAA